MKKTKKKLTTSSVPDAEKVSETNPLVGPSNFFLEELLLMMHAVGDSPRPCKQAASLVEEIVYSQMCSLISRAGEICTLRQADEITVEDILFLTRSSPSKCARLLDFFKFKDKKNDITKALSMKEFTEPTKLSKSAVANELVSRIDPYGLLSGQNEPEKIKRLQKAEEQTRRMNTEEYMFYTEARQVTFLKNMDKFMFWFAKFMSGSDTKIHPLAWEAVAYLAHETVVCLVELALLIKQEQMPAKPCNSLSFEVTAKKNNLLAKSEILEAYRRYTSRRGCKNYAAGKSGQNSLICLL